MVSNSWLAINSIFNQFSFIVLGANRGPTDRQWWFAFICHVHAPALSNQNTLMCDVPSSCDAHIVWISNNRLTGVMCGVVENHIAIDSLQQWSVRQLGNLQSRM